MTPESTEPVGKEAEGAQGRAQGSLLLPPSPAGWYFRDGKPRSEAHTQCPELTCSQETKGHTAEKPGDHGSIPRHLLIQGGVSWGEQSKVLHLPFPHRNM